MGDQAALQEAIQRARQLAAKINPQSQPVKRLASTMDQSGPIKVTLAYEKPINRQNDEQARESRQRSSSRDHNRNRRDSRDSRDYKDNRDHSRDNNYNRESRESNRNINSSLTSQNLYDNSGPLLPSSRNSDDKIEIIIPHAVIGLVIGKGGENIKRIQNETGATVRVDPNTIDERGNKLCTITGTKNAVEEARIQVENVIESAGTSKRPRLQPEGSDSYRLKIPASRTGAIIGKGGETIKSIKQQSGCDIELDKVAKDCGPEESIFIIRGSQDKIMKARALIETRLASRSNRDGDRPRDSDNHQNHSSRSSSKGVITGANAAPVSQGQFSEMPSTYPAAAGQQNSADMTAAWAAYFAQYSTLFNQAGGQPGAPAGMPYAGQPNMMSGAPSVPAQATAQAPSGQQMPQLDAQQTTVGDPNQGGQVQQDFSDQWIEYYLANGRPDYAEQIIQMKKQQQAQKQTQS